MYIHVSGRLVHSLATFICEKTYLYTFLVQFLVQLTVHHIKVQIS